MDNRRKHERVLTNLPACWEGLAGRHEARIEDLSRGGCFVNTKGRVDEGEAVGIEIKLPSGVWLKFRGTVTFYDQGIGFGAAFSDLTDEEEQAIAQLL
jgi:hypothetical protein